LGEIRRLIRTPLRGELTLPSSGNTDHPAPDQALEETLESLPKILSQIVYLAQPRPIPAIQISTPPASGQAPAAINNTPFYPLARSSSLSQLAKEATRPWSNTISETASTETALLPFLVHLAVVRDDADALRFCFDTSSASIQDTTPMTEHQSFFPSGVTDVPQSLNNLGFSGKGVPGGVVNALDPASGRTPLHVAALHGSKACAKLLLESGALVHLRDTLDHTALYYVSGQSCTQGQLTKLCWETGGPSGA
jgi:60kDa lysophospholipase